MRRFGTLGTTYIEIGGSIRLTYPSGECMETLWVTDDSLVLWVMVSPHRFCNIYHGGKMGFEYVTDRGVERIIWRDITMPPEYWLDDAAHGRLRAISVVEMVRRRLGVPA